MAARFDGWIAGVIRDALDHRLRPAVNLLVAGVGEPGDQLEALARERQREVVDEIGRTSRLKRIEDTVRVALKFLAPVRAHNSRRHRREEDRALRHVRIAVLAHHVVAHELTISPAGWSDENTSMRFSETKMSSRRVSSVDPSCGTKQIGASRRISASAG